MGRAGDEDFIAGLARGSLNPLSGVDGVTDHREVELAATTNAPRDGGAGVNPNPKANLAGKSGAYFGDDLERRILSANADGGEDWNKGIVLGIGKNELFPPTLTVKSFSGKKQISDLVLGAKLRAMGTLQDSFFTGDLAELVICTGAVPQEQDAALKNYLSNKYGIK